MVAESEYDIVDDVREIEEGEELDRYHWQDMNLVLDQELVEKDQ